MRLLKTRSSNLDGFNLVLEEFDGQNIPPYAILSHTWEEEEVLFIHVRDGCSDMRKGYSKIKFAADQARQDGFDYVWIDTCCIDKSSSAELSEAINSMYTWYKSASVCYAYLADVPANDGPADKNSAFAFSKWFTRGWCLQELLAPRDLIFFSKEWVAIGKKGSHAEHIASITGIDVDVLTGKVSLHSLSVARRMSWAAFRRTTRVEDIAYCLMGIFSVNMPMLYGEGMKAFQRLQEEVMKNSDDYSLFAWTDPNIPEYETHGLLADSPSAFAKSGSVRQYHDWEDRPPFDMSNTGLRISLHITEMDKDCVQAAFNCPDPRLNPDASLTVYLKKMGETGVQYARVRCGELGLVGVRGIPRTIFIRQATHRPLVPIKYRFLQLWNDLVTTYGWGFVDIVHNTSTVSAIPISSDYQENQRLPERYPRCFQIPWTPRTLVVAILFTDIIILLGTLSSAEIGFHVVPAQQSGSLLHLQRLFDPLPATQYAELEGSHYGINVKICQYSDGVTFVVDIGMTRKVPFPKPATTGGKPFFYMRDFDRGRTLGP